ncbi:MAG: putative Ig domain-containing protein [Chloroflexota bacterium]
MYFKRIQNRLRSSLPLSILIISLSLLSLAMSSQETSTTQAPSDADLILTYTLDRSAVPLLYYNDLTLNVITGPASEIVVVVDGSVIPHTFDSVSGLTVFTTSGNNIEIHLTGHGSPNNFGQISPAPLKENKKFAWSISFDDNIGFQPAINLLNQYGYRGTIFAIANIIDDTRDQDWIIDAPGMKTLLSQGWSLAPHGWNNTCDDYTLAETTAAFDRIEQIVSQSAVPNYLVTSFAAPCFIGDYHPIILQLRDGNNYDAQFNESGERALMRVEPGVTDTLEANDGRSAIPLNLVMPLSEYYFQLDRDDPIGRDWSIEDNVTRAMATVDWMATNAINGQHFWYNTFLHSSDGVILNIFLNHLQTNYSNDVLVAPSDEIYSYLLTRDLTVIAADPISQNQPPILSNPGDQSNERGESINLVISATDTDGDSLSYSATGLPTGLTIEQAGGTIAGTIDVSGNYSVVVAVDDGNGGSDSVSFNWTVMEPQPSGSTVLIDARGSAGGEVLALKIQGQPVQSWTVTTDIQSFSYTHSETVTTDHIRIEFTNDGRDPITNADRNLIVDKITVDGTPYETEAANVEGKGVWNGLNCSVVAFHQDQMLACNGYFQYTSAAVNQPPTLPNPGTQTSTLGTPATLALAASDPEGNTLTYSADGLPAGLSIDGTSGLISGTPTTLGTSNVMVTVSDGNGGSVNAQFIWVIVDEPVVGCGGLIQEAESVPSAGNFVIGSGSGASGGQFIHVPNGTGNQWNGPSEDRADFCFTIATGGTYRLLATILAPGGNSNSFYVAVDGQPTDGYLWDTATDSAGYIDDYVNQRGGPDPLEFNLSQGEHTVTIYAREDGTVLDKLALELVNSDPPMATCNELSSEAEWGLLNGSFVIGNDPNASGGSYIHLPNGTGNNLNGTTVAERAEFCLTVPVAGTYLLEGTVLANGGGNNSFYVTVDGHPSTGYLWDTATHASDYIQDFVSHRGGADPLQLSLNAGEHTIIVYPREDGTLLDRLTLVDSGGIGQIIQRELEAELGSSAVSGTIRVPKEVAVEPSISGLQVTILDSASEDIVATGKTNAIGKYYTDGIYSGSYQVQVEIPLLDGSTQQLTQSITVAGDGVADSSFSYPVASEEEQEEHQLMYLYLPLMD